jgi:excisionase family DNA binding protein
MSDEFILLRPDALEAIVRRAVREEQRIESLPEVLTREQAGELLHLHPQVVVRYVKERGLPGVKLGSEWRFRRSALLAWLDMQERKAG